LNHEITHNPAFAMLCVDLQPGERLVAEPGAMVAMTRNINLEAKLTTSASPGFGATVKALLAAVVRKYLGGESFFVSHYTTPQPGSVWIAPGLSGGISHTKLENGRMMMSSGAYLASTGNIDVSAKYGGIRGVLAKEGAFFLQVSGTGDVWFNSFGGVEVIDVQGTYMVDNGHIVAWTGDLRYTMKSAGGGLVGMFASGEGIVCEFQGNGKLWIQSRNMQSIVSWIIPLLPAK